MALSQIKKQANELVGAELGCVITVNIDVNTSVTGRLTGITLGLDVDYTVITYETKIKRETATTTLVIDQVGALVVPGTTSVTVHL